MTKGRTTARAFHESEGVEDWRVLYGGAFAHFRTESYADAIRFVSGVGQVAADLAHFPDLDVRPEGVTVRSFTDPTGGLSSADIDLARKVSEVASTMNLKSDPSQLKMISLAVAHDADSNVQSFWAAALGYEELGDDATDPTRRTPFAAFHPFRTPRPGRGRLHIDISVPADEAEKRVDAALAAGGRLVEGRSNPPMWWTLASPDNHGIDIAAWPDFEDFGEEE